MAASIGAKAQQIIPPYSGGGTTGGASLTGNNTFTGINTFNGGLNNGSTGGYQLSGSSILNTLSNTSSPILSPETANSPTQSALYMGYPLVQGWTDTTAPVGPGGTYSQMITDQVTLLNGGTNHYGLEERTLSTAGTATFTGELNVSKFMLQVNSGATSASGEAIEGEANNYGNAGTLKAIVINNVNNSSGTIGGYLWGIDIGWANNNTASNSIGEYDGIVCEANAGPGNNFVTHPNCLKNVDPAQAISTEGPIVFHNSGSNPAVTACGTACPTQLASNSDMAGVVTEGTSATGFTLTFLLSKPYVAPNCAVWPENGAAATAYSGSGYSLTLSQTTLVVAHASANSATFGYVCFNNY